ncbi:outer membrane protein assembly complex protein YaeT [Paraburkholderia sp. RAU2J]|uniref:outer membrane protein assembly factor BamA n=1 Tax=Paraburkholderia sp. RAU2J TaxID=1938810 RepID=UPI000EB48723|nr:outer membrane protein assembly factor BamA [Paraburkholderia sp. RAU2J]RKT13720.1 outer membrane protein assembly complex protein YaeT [Paraburkholderia sp. RAU2J]
MNKVYRIAWHVATHTPAGTLETNRARGRGSAGLMWSGIAAAVSVGIPYSRIAQAAPSASYMIVASRGAGLPQDFAGNVSAAASGDSVENHAGAFVLTNEAFSSDVMADEYSASASEGVTPGGVALGNANLDGDTSGRNADAVMLAAPSAPDYSKSWTESRNGSEMQVSTSARVVASAAPVMAEEGAAVGTMAKDSAARDGDASAGLGVPDVSSGSGRSGQDAGPVGRKTEWAASPEAQREGGRGEGAVNTAVRRGEGELALAPNEASETSAARVPARELSAANVDIAHHPQDESATSAGGTGKGQLEDTRRNAAGATVSGVAGVTAELGGNVKPDMKSGVGLDVAPNAAQIAAKGKVASAAGTTPKDGARFHEIRFSGNSVFGSKALQDEMQLFATDWTSWYAHNDVYSQDRLATGLEKIRQYYLDHGYLEFKAESVATSGDKGVSLSIAVHEGELYTLSAVRITGSPPELQPELERLVQLRAGEVLSVGKLLAGTNAIVDKLGEQGYVYATVNPLSRVDADNHTVDMTLQIDTGRRTYVRQIAVTGNTITHDKVVRREIIQSEHDWYDSKKVAASQDRLNRLGYFSKVEVTTVPVEGASDQVDLDVKVVEKPGATVRLGAGYSSTDRTVLSAGITQDNVLGTGTSLGVNVTAAKLFRTFSVTQSDPYFTSGGVSRTTSAYYHSNQPLYYSSDSRFKVVTTGLDTRFGVPVGDADKAYVGVAFEHYRLDPDDKAPQSYIAYVDQYGRDSNGVPIMVGWSRDRRDSAVFPSQGYFAQAGVEYGTPIGGNQYYKADINARYYYALARGVVLSLNLQGGYGDGLGNKPYPLFKNYFAGGIGSVRGFEPNSLGPRDPKTGVPIGGSRMLTGNVELKAPVPGLRRDDRLGVFAFIDGGNVWGTQGPSVGANGVRFSYGAGFAWNSPIGSFKISAGFPITRHDFDNYQKIQMQFATKF